MSPRRLALPALLWASSLAGACGGEAGGSASAPPPSPDAGYDGSSCKPSDCASQSADCGSAPDGCGGVLECGACASPKFCGGGGPNRCGDSPCVPKTCAELGAGCGSVSDQCSSTLDCGMCPAPQTCGGSGVSNQCGCTPLTCAAAGAACGDIPDGCGGALACGGCPAPDVCGGAGTVNQCGTPCDLIAKNPKWVVCKETATHCSGLYKDGAGCTAYCKAAGMVCKGRFGAHDTCQKETEYSIPCAEKNDHLSDWCECGY